MIETKERKPSRDILNVVHSLERYGKYDFRNDGAIKIEKWKLNRALEKYKSTLLAVRGTVEAEPPSATMIERATVSWKLEPADIGNRVRQRHVGLVHPEVRPLVDAWYKAGRPYPSSGGLYYTVPNKSYTRVKELAAYPELRDAVLNLGLEERWLRFFEVYLTIRYDVSRQLLEMLKSGADPEALSRHNEEAGTGISVRGRLLKRKDMASVAGDLDFLLSYAYSLGVAFAAVQLAQLDPDHVWVIDVYDSRIRGAIASRSDMDVMGVSWNGEILTIEGVAQTRQAGSDASGALANSYTEKKLMGSSVTEYVLRQLKHPRVEYPFTNKRLLTEIWSLDAKPFAGQRYVIGEDLGLTEPVKSPADALFSRAFLRIGTSKMLSLMLSGSSWTQAVYSVFHHFFGDKVAADDRILALGDDINLVTAHTTEDIFNPYKKVKSTDPDSNTKKILGVFTAFSPEPDPQGTKPALMGTVPRVLKTVSSATKRSSAWGEKLSRLDPMGTIELAQPEETLHTVRKDLQVLLPYMQWSGPRAQLAQELESRWMNIPSSVWQVLLKHNEELEHRIVPERDEPETNEED